MHSECAKLCVILQSFLRDAEQLESLTASHEAFLDFDDLGVSLFILSQLFSYKLNKYCLSVCVWMLTRVAQIISAAYTDL